MLRDCTTGTIATTIILITLASAVFGSTPLLLDSQRHITVDEITPDMDAYCLTVYKGVEIEKFELEIIDVIHNYRPGRDAILVIGTDERFIHTGPVAGCSGSPVYIDGRLAGALAFGWGYSKDPLYGVTPIEEMLRTGTYQPESTNMAAVNFDMKKPLDLQNAYRRTKEYFKNTSTAGIGKTAMICPLSSSLPMSAFDNIAPALESASLMPVSAAGAGNMEKYKDVKLAPGNIIAVPLVSGDIEMSAIGTVTEVLGDKVFAFGHSFLGQGPVDMPMATGYVNTVVASLLRSFKFGQSIDIKGALYADESTAIAGQIGRVAKTIPMKITIDRFNDEKKRTYNCRMAHHRLFTPMLTDACIHGTATMRGDLPIEHLIEYRIKIDIENQKSIEFENFSSASKLYDVIERTSGAIALIMNNPYQRANITSLDFELKILPGTAVSHIWSFEVSDTTVEPGRQITAELTIESYLAGRKSYPCKITIPEDTAPGSYTLTASGTGDYDRFKRKAAPYKYIPENLPTLIDIINEIANLQSDQLHLVLTLPPSGVAIESAVLEDLPVSKAVLLTDKKRTGKIMPVLKYIEKTVPVGTIVLDKKSISITVKPRQ